MDSANREQGLSRAFVDLAQSLVSEFDVLELAQVLVERVTDLFDVDAAGLLIIDLRGNLELLASSTESTRLLELFQLQNAEGPCLDCFDTGLAVSVPDIATTTDRWPRFVQAAHEQGFAAVHALPMRLSRDVIGALGMFSTAKGALNAADLAAAQALADVATVAVLLERASLQRELVLEQTQAALNGRVVVEEAKGMLLAHGVGLEEAVDLMRTFARQHDSKLVSVAQDLAEGRLDPAAVVASPGGINRAWHTRKG